MVVKVDLIDAYKTIKGYEKLGYLHVETVQTIDGVTLRFRDPIVLEENNITDIQFHEGDYVENNEGKIGYISSICHCDECKKRGFFEPTITYSDGTTDYISNYSVKTVSFDYKQIGTQKFSTEYSTEHVLRKKIVALEKENKELKEKVDNISIQRNHAMDLLCFYNRDDIKQLGYKRHQ